MIYFYISLSTYLCYNIVKYKNILNKLQENKYDIKKYTNYIFKNAKTLFLTPELLSIIVIILAFKTNLKVIGVANLILYTILFLLNYKKRNKVKIESKMIIRIILLILMNIGLNIYFILDYMSYHYADIIFDNTPMYYIILITVIYFLPLIVWIINVLAQPIDKLIKPRR